MCDQCAKVIQADDITIHYTIGKKRLEIDAICQLCLDNYLEKTKSDANRKSDENEKEMVVKFFLV